MSKKQFSSIWGLNKKHPFKSPIIDLKINYYSFTYLKIILHSKIWNLGGKSLPIKITTNSKNWNPFFSTHCAWDLPHANVLSRMTPLVFAQATWKLIIVLATCYWRCMSMSCLCTSDLKATHCACNLRLWLASCQHLVLYDPSCLCTSDLKATMTHSHDTRLHDTLPNVLSHYNDSPHDALYLPLIVFSLTFMLVPCSLPLRNWLATSILGLRLAQYRRQGLFEPVLALICLTSYTAWPMSAAWHPPLPFALVTCSLPLR